MSVTKRVLPLIENVGVRPGGAVPANQESWSQSRLATVRMG